MIRRAILPKKAVSAPRRALLLTVIAWMNIAMAPCAMAFGDAPSCPHGAAQADSAGMAHHGGHEGHEGHGASHETAASTDCGIAAGDCCATQNDGATDTRGQKTIDAIDGDEVTLFESQSFATATADTAMRRSVDRPPGRFVPSPAIHVLNCVYRD